MNANTINRDSCRALDDKARPEAGWYRLEYADTQKSIVQRRGGVNIMNMTKQQ